MIYQWKINKYNVAAQDAGEYLKNIEQRDGKVSPKTIVDESRPSETLLHNCFEWNDEAAAEKYREEQAKGIIRNIVVVQTSNERREPVHVRAFVSVENNQEKKQYIAIDTAMNNTDTRQQIIQSALKELDIFKKKYQDLSEFTELFKVIETYLGKVS